MTKKEAVEIFEIAFRKHVEFSNKYEGTEYDADAMTSEAVELFNTNYEETDLEGRTADELKELAGLYFADMSTK